MNSNFEAESFETGGELESESEYLIQPRGGRSASGMRGLSARPQSFARGAGAFGRGLRGPIASQFATQGSGSSGRRHLGSGDFRGRFGHSSWRYPWAGSSGFGPISMGSSDFVASMQSCLGQLVGSWVPQNGIMGPGTRRAIRIFQTKSGMAVTGLLDEGTVSAIQSGCSSPAGPEGPGRAGVPPPASPEAPTGPEDAPAPPAGGAAGEGGGEMESELEQGIGLEQEFRVSAPCDVQLLQAHSRVAMTEPTLSKQLPKQPGLYIIYVQRKPWYVGVAETTLHERFRQRFKVFRDFNLPTSVLANREVSWIAVDTEKMKACAVERRKQGSSQPFKQSPGIYGVLKVIEQHLIKRAGTAGLGNKSIETVVFGPKGSVEITRHGAGPVKFDAAHPI